MNKSTKTKLAFTLIELLVVIAIIGILSALIIVGMSSTTQKAAIAKAQVFSNSLRNSLMSNIVAQYSFDDIDVSDYDPTTKVINNDAGNIPDSWLDNEGRAYNGPVLKDGNDCVSGKCLSFDGTNDYVEIPNNSSIKPTTAISFGGWAYSTNWVELTDDRLLSCTEIGGYNIAFSGSDVVILLHRNSVYGSCTYGLNLLSSGWHYFLGTYDGRYTKAYIDGIQAGTTDDAGANYPIGYTYNNSLMIGAEASSNNSPYLSYFSGKIDDVRIYGAAMPTSQIQQNYFAGINKLFAKNQITQSDYHSRIANLTNNYAKE